MLVFQTAYLRIARYGGMTSYAAALFGFGLNGDIIGSGATDMLGGRLKSFQTASMPNGL